MKVIYDKNTERLLSGAHLLIAGTTGSGKSVVLNNIIYQLTQKPPNEIELALIDPKRVSLRQWKELPHVTYYATEAAQAANLLKILCNRMMDRYEFLEHNQTINKRLYIVIDELADLMILNKAEIIPPLQRILQLGRESKLSVIMATQAPNRSIIPANLILNCDNRLALRCIDKIESRQIIGTNGAELLPKYGSGILRDCDGIHNIKIDIIPPEEIKNIIEFWKDT